jgi:hypothetical protein
MLFSRTVETVIGPSVLYHPLPVIVPSAAFANSLGEHEESMAIDTGNHPKLGFSECEQGMDRHTLQSPRWVVQFAGAFVTIPVQS